MTNEGNKKHDPKSCRLCQKCQCPIHSPKPETPKEDQIEIHSLKLIEIHCPKCHRTFPKQDHLLGCKGIISACKESCGKYFENHCRPEIEEDHWESELFEIANENNAVKLRDFFRSTIAKEREKVFQKMIPYTIKAKESERVADFTLDQFKSLFN